MSRALGETLANAAAGFVLGNLAAILLAALALLWPRSEGVVTSLALLVFCLPFVATGPSCASSSAPAQGRRSQSPRWPSTTPR
jgi:sulfonate transport system permease protein